MRISINPIAACIFTAAFYAGLVFGVGSATAQTAPRTQPVPPAPAHQEGWEEIDQRMVFLTIQLSTIESSIDATNKSLKANGYKQAVQQGAADRARAGNELMDRKGGGPVPWQEFYGKTAERFFYHPNGATVYVNPLPIGQRPPQFEYIYRANESARQRAEEQAAQIGNKIEDLLAYRRQLETEQSALWCKIAFRGVSSMDLPLRPLYRLELGGGGAGEMGRQQIEAIKAAVQFVRAIDAELALAQKAPDADQKDVLDHLLLTTTASRSEMQTKLLAFPAVTDTLTNIKSPLAQFARAAKRLEDVAQNLVDALRLASDCDAREDPAGKNAQRGQLQQMFFDYAATVVTADQLLNKAADEWKVKPLGAKVEPPRPAPANLTTGSGGDSIPSRLAAAKAAWAKEIADARRVLVATTDARLNAAADAGDLEAVQSLQSAKIKASLDGTLPQDTKDPTVLAAKKTMDESVTSANGRLVSAYREAVKNYTRARKISEAQATQDELVATGLSAAVAASESPAGAGAPPAMEARVTPPAVEPGGAGAPEGSFPPPKLPDGRLEVELPAPIDSVAVGGGGRYLVLHLPKLQQLAFFDVSQAKVLKYAPLPSSDVAFSAGQTKLYVALKDLRQVQRWDLVRQVPELTVPAPEGGAVAIAAGAASTGPVVLLGEKRFWQLDPLSLKALPYPSKNWGTDGSAWGPVHAHISFDGSTVVACGGGWAGIELSNLNANKVVNVQAGGYVNGDTLVAGNGALVFPEKGGILRSDVQSKVTGIDGEVFPADDPAFSLSFQKSHDKHDRHNKNTGSSPSLVLFSNADPRPLITFRDLPELAEESKIPLWERVHVIPRGNVMITVAQGGTHLVLRKFDLAQSLEAEGIDYLFVESAPIAFATRGGRYTYKMKIRSKKGGVKAALQSGPKGMTVSKDGLVSWQVPLRLQDPHVTVIVQVSNDSGQSAFHSFSINVGENIVHR
jgi:hypothetical protein